jgi:DNA-binding LytR/AlgR family response regulator
MEGTNGIETAKKLRERDEDTILIFITAILEYVFEAFDVAAFYYLLKPIEEEYGEFVKAYMRYLRNGVNEDA